MKKFIALVLFAFLLFSLCACGDPTQGGGPITVTANSRDGYAASNAADGDLTTGWIGSRKANETVPQLVDIDLGSQRTIRKITIDDTFAAGFTNEKPEYLAQSVIYGRGDASSIEGGSSVPFILNGAADGQGWKSEDVPTRDDPQWLYFSLRQSCETTKIVLDNEMNNSVIQSCSIYYSAEPIDENKDLSDPSNYTLLTDITDNTENVKEIVLEESITVSNMLILFRSQVNEGEQVVASLDEIFFYAPVGDNYSEPHQPVRFHIMGSNDGNTYETFIEENGNYSEVYIKELDTPVSYRYLRYLLFEEYNNNYPSIGEFTVE